MEGAIDSDQKIRLAHKEFAHKKTKNDCKLRNTFQKIFFLLQILKFADNKTANNEVRLCITTLTVYFIFVFF